MGFETKNKLTKPRHPFEGLFKALIHQVSALLLISFHLVVVCLVCFNLCIFLISNLALINLGN